MLWLSQQYRGVSVFDYTYIYIYIYIYIHKNWAKNITCDAIFVRNKHHLFFHIQKPADVPSPSLTVAIRVYSCTRYVMVSISILAWQTEWQLHHRWDSFLDRFKAETLLLCTEYYHSNCGFRDTLHVNFYSAHRQWWKSFSWSFFIVGLYCAHAYSIRQCPTNIRQLPDTG